MIYFDEVGVIVCVVDIELLMLWDVYDWYGLFWCECVVW